jgi:PAS domain S-box-containing protein
LLKVAAALFVCEFAVMCVLPVFGLAGMWESMVDGILLAIVALPTLYILGFSPRRFVKTDSRRGTGLEGRMVALLVANVVMILLVIAVYGLLVNGQESGARMINVAGQQRMLSQRLVQATMLEAMDLAHGDPAERQPGTSETIARCSAQFEQALRGLIEGNAELGLVPCPSREAGRQLEVVGPAWDQFRALLQRTSEPSDMNEAHAYFTSLEGAGDRVLGEMDKAVDLLEQHYEGRARLLRTVLGPTIAFATGTGILLVITIRQVTRHRQQLQAELLQTNEDLLAINKLHQALFRARTRSDVATTITDTLVRDFNAYFARVWLVEPGDLCSQCANAKACSSRERCLHLIASSGRYTHIDGDHRRVPLGAFKIGLIAEGRGKTICNDVVNDDRVHDREWAAKHGLRSFAGFPLVREGEVIGVMALFSRRELPQSLLSTLELLAHMCTLALVNVENAETLRDREEMFRSITTSAQDAIIMISSDGKISFWNEAAKAIFGYTQKEVVGTCPYTVLFPERLREERFHAWRKFLLTGRGADMAKTVELTVVKKSGAEFPAELSSSAVRIKGRWHGIIILRDITERKATEVHVRTLSRATEQSPASVVITDTRGTIEYVNPKFTEVTGYTPEEVIGRNPRLLKSGKLPPEVYKAMWDKLLSGEVWTGEFQNRKKNGELYWEAASVSPVRNAEGEIAHFVGVKLDITKAKEAEEDRLRHLEVEQERNALRGAVKAQERLLGVVGHELRTPLAGIRAIAELLLDDGAREMAEFDTFLANIHDEAVRMSGLVNDLLEVARMRSGVASWNWSMVALQEVCEAAVRTIRPLIDRARVEVTTKVDPPDLVMRGDNNGIRQLLINLLSNAGKHTPKGSIQVLATGFENDGQSFIRLTVSDTGSGMTPEVARRLGEAFALNSGVIGASCVKGSGLGLAICRGIVTAHGGKITVKSAQGTGSVFTAMLRADLEGPASTVQETRIECEVT